VAVVEVVVDGVGSHVTYESRYFIIIRSRHTDAHQDQIKLTFDHFDTSPIFVQFRVSYHYQSYSIENENVLTWW